MTARRSSLLGVGALSLSLSLSLSACGESPAIVDPPKVAGSVSTESSRVIAHQAGLLLRQTEVLASAIGDPQFRQLLIRDIRESDKREGKLIWGTYARLRAKEIVAAANRRGLVAIEEDLFSSSTKGLALYMPYRAHRLYWKGDANVLVAAQRTSRDPIVAYSTAGERFTLDVETPPSIPVLAITASELADEDVVVDARVESPQQGPSLQTLCEEPMGGAGVLSFVGDDCDGGGGGGGGITPPPGVYMTQMTVNNKAEPWIRGDPEIEVVLLGTVSGRHFGAVFPAPGPQQVLFQSGNFRVPISCSGRLAPTYPGSLKRFDYNDDGGTVYNQSVLLEQRDEFGVREEVAGVGNSVLFARDQSVFAPFYVEVWERDDGGECPKPAQPWLPVFNVNFTFQTYPSPTRLTKVMAGPSLSSWLSQLGITNENDNMASFVFSSWTAFENLAPSTLLFGSHVRIRLSNTGVDRHNVPVY